MNYDYDVIVIGGGPAGSSAAIRPRWVRTYNSIPASVAIFDKKGIGGIANWKEIRITGENWKGTGSSLMDRLNRDIVDLNIPIYYEDIISLNRDKDKHIIETEKGQYSALSVIISTGLTVNNNQKEYLGKGLIPTLKDHEYMEDLLDTFLEKNKGKHIIITGTEPVTKFYEFFNRINKNRASSELLIENKDNRIKEIIGNGDNVEGIRLNKESASKDIKADVIIMDFESYMLKNNSSYFLPDEINRDNGFILVDRSLATNIPGIFAAGDITGPPFCFAKSIGEGVTAGFEAYRYTFRKKFGIDPPTFAFYGSKEPEYHKNTGFSTEIVKERHKPKLLDSREDLSNLEIILDGKHTLEEIFENKSKDEEDNIKKILFSLLKEKKLTFHI